jgi:NAD-dependent dihydropyrimidine dehydrogenase PreA subunit
MKRKIISIDEEKCNGCGLCIPACHEGALQVIDGKVRLISDLFCDGLGACIGHCPEDAITIEEREAEPYDEGKVMESIVKKGRNTILAHLEHLRDHNEEHYLKQAIRFLKERNIDLRPEEVMEPVATAGRQEQPKQSKAHGCPGSVARDFTIDMAAVGASVKAAPSPEPEGIPSELRQWPVQLHLLNPQASYFRGADVLLAADCVAFSMGDFHPRFLKGKSLAIACPKLDTNKESYVQKLTAMIRDSGVRSLTVMIMEVPCCGGLLQMSKIAREQAGSNLPIRVKVVGVIGELLEETEI